MTVLQRLVEKHLMNQPHLMLTTFVVLLNDMNGKPECGTHGAFTFVVSSF